MIDLSISRNQLVTPTPAGDEAAQQHTRSRSLELLTTPLRLPVTAYQRTTQFISNLARLRSFTREDAKDKVRGLRCRRCRRCRRCERG